MIDREAFAQVWARLCRRFNREADPAEVQDYLDYLDASGVTTEAFVAASEAAWATREFFPRPADFLAGESVRGWRALQAMAGLGQYEPEKIKAARDAVPIRAWKAIQAIGGIDAIREARDVSYVRREFLSAYEAQVQEEALGLDRKKLEEAPTASHLRSSGGKPQRLLTAAPKPESEVA
jgi:hypothetical protein